MTTKRVKSKLKYVLYALLLLAAASLSWRGLIPAFADTTGYTSALQDLKKDSSFNLSDYPENSANYSINVIQITESIDNELFLYTYQPCQKTYYSVATKINMSLTETVNDINQYDLTLLNSDGVFCKYKVKGLTVSTSAERLYNITSIFRPWNNSIDDEAGNENTVNGVAYPVGQLWKITTVAGDVKYEMTAQETIKVTSQMIGMRRYNDGFQFAGTKSCDSHYIAFTCDHKIDKLLSTKIEFVTTPYKTLKGSGTTYGEPTPHSVTLCDYQVASNDGSGWFGKQEEWHRMTSIKQFVKEVEMSETEKNTLSAYDWILNFYETTYTVEAGGKDILIGAFLPFGFVWALVDALTTTGEIVSEVAMLRLEFNCDDEIYNLGVISDIQTGSNKPTNQQEGFNFFVYIWDCLVKLFTGKANTIQTIVAVVTLIVAVVVIVLAVKFLRWVITGIFGKGKK